MANPKAPSKPSRRAVRQQSWQRECTSIAYNGSFGGEAGKPQSGAPRRRVRMIMDVVEIQKYLPHRYPFLMVDGILEIERLKRIVGIKNVTSTNRTFRAISRAAGYARRADHRSDGADRRTAAAAGSSGPREQAALFCGGGWRAIPASGGAGRSIEA